jgi:polyisoprenoid-binding protein YceI
MMKRNFTSLIALLCGLLPFQIAQAAPESYEIDNTHSYVLWQINHLGYSTQAGKWYVNGNLVIDEQDHKNDKLDVTIKVADFITGLPELDKHLKSKLFFNVDQFPTATFVSNKVTVKSNDTARVEGKLTLRGVTKEMAFDVKLNKKGPNPLTNKMSLGFSGETKVKRSDFGMVAYLPGLSDDVHLDLELEASKKSA